MKKTIKKIISTLVFTSIILSSVFTSVGAVWGENTWTSATSKSNLVFSGSGKVPTYAKWKDNVVNYTYPWLADSQYTYATNPDVTLKSIVHESEPGSKVWCYTPYQSSYKSLSTMNENGPNALYYLSLPIDWSAADKKTINLENSKYNFVNKNISTSFRPFKVAKNYSSYNYYEKDKAFNNDPINGYMYVQNNGTWYDSVMGAIGEYRYYGYTSSGRALENSSYPMDSPSRLEWEIDDSLDSYVNLDTLGGDYKTPYDNVSDIASYNHKLQAIQEVVNSTPIWNKAKYTAQYIMNLNSLSLRTDPEVDVQILRGVTKQTDSDGIVHQQYRSYTGGANAWTDNMVLTSINIYHNVVDINGNKTGEKELVANFTRDENVSNKVTYNQYKKLVTGNTYTAEYNVYNDEANTTKQLSLNVGYKINENVQYTDESIGFTHNDVKYEKSSNSIASYKSGKLNYDFKVPYNATIMEVNGIINNKHVEAGENMDLTDDWGKIKLDVDIANIQGSKVELVDEIGNLVSNNEMKPGIKYSHKYTYNVYANENRDTAEGISFVSHTVRQLRGLPGNGDVLDYTLNNGNKVQVMLEEMYYNISSLTVEGSKKLDTR